MTWLAKYGAPRCHGPSALTNRTGLPISRVAAMPPWLIAVWIITLMVPRLNAQVQLDRIMPPVVASGSEVKLKAEGKFPNWPVGIYCDRADVQIRPDESSGELVVSVPASAPPGLAWIRLYDASSASNLTPILVEPMECLHVVEPNDDPEHAQPVSLPVCVGGKLEKSEDVDGFLIALKQGETLVATVVAARVLQSPMDAVLQISDTRGNVLAQSDDERGYDPQIVFTAKQSRKLIVRLFAFPQTPNSTIGFAGGAAYGYALRLTKTPLIDHFLPLAANSDASEPQFRAAGWGLGSEEPVQLLPPTQVSPPLLFVEGRPGWQWIAGTDSKISTYVNDDDSTTKIIQLPALLSGHILSEAETDQFTFSAAKGKKYRALVHCRQLGFPLDSRLRILTADKENELASNDDIARNTYDSRLEFTAKEDGELVLEVSDAVSSGSLRHAYSVELAEVRPSVKAKLSADHFSIAAGESTEIVLTIDRRDGYSKKLTAQIEGLPTGISMEPAISEAKGDSSKTLKLKLSADEGATAQNCTIRIGLKEMESEKVQNASESQSVMGSYQLRPGLHIHDFWLTVTAKKKS